MHTLIKAHSIQQCIHRYCQIATLAMWSGSGVGQTNSLQQMTGILCHTWLCSSLSRSLATTLRRHSSWQPPLGAFWPSSKKLLSFVIGRTLGATFAFGFLTRPELKQTWIHREARRKRWGRNIRMIGINNKKKKTLFVTLGSMLQSLMWQGQAKSYQPYLDHTLLYSLTWALECRVFTCLSDGYVFTFMYSEFHRETNVHASRQQNTHCWCTSQSWGFQGFGWTPGIAWCTPPLLQCHPSSSPFQLACCLFWAVVLHAQ